MIEGDDAINASAKEGIGIEEILEAIVTRVPPPKGARRPSARRSSSTRTSTRIAASSRTCASSTASCKRARASCRWRTGASSKCIEVGVFRPRDAQDRTRSSIGDVGYVIANIKSLGDIDVGDTITDADDPGARAAAGLQADRPDGVLRAVSERRRRGLATCATRSRSLKLNDSALHLRAGDRRSRSASASAAGSWACCTWRSCRSGWSASTTST